MAGWGEDVGVIFQIVCGTEWIGPGPESVGRIARGAIQIANSC
jgi:hypothetical protein